MEEKKLTKIKIIGGIVVTLVILGILGYQIYQKVTAGKTNEIAIEIILAVVSLFLLGRILFFYFKTKKK